MSANDPDDYVQREIDWIGAPFASSGRFGVCLGAQMLARQFGARVDSHRQGSVEVGYYPIRPTRAGLKVCRTGPTVSTSGTRKALTFPRGCELLVEGDDFPKQAIRHGNAFGVQFHPDVTYAMMYRWMTRASTSSIRRAHIRAQHFAHRAVYDVAEGIWLKHFLEDWLAGAGGWWRKRRRSAAGRVR